MPEGAAVLDDIRVAMAFTWRHSSDTVLVGRDDDSTALRATCGAGVELDGDDDDAAFVAAGVMVNDDAAFVEAGVVDEAAFVAAGVMLGGSSILDDDGIYGHIS